MAISRLFFVAAASLILLSCAAAVTDNRTITLVDETKCLTKMNEARRKANLEDLPDGERKADDPGSGKTPTGIWKHVCQALFAEEEFQPQKELDSSETYALFKLDTSTRGAGGPITPSDAECSAAVQEWQEGFDKFDDNSAVNGGLNYADVASEQASFVTLYNPNDDATGHCSVATCEIPAAIRDEPQKKASGIVCSTTPSAFKNQKLFKESVWQQIKEALTPIKEDEQKITITDGNSCLTKLNAAREEAGLSTLTPNKTLFPVAGEAKTSGVSKAVCDTLLTVSSCLETPGVCQLKAEGKDFKPLEALTSPGTFAVFKLSGEGEDGSVEKRQLTPTNAQCSAAVEEWQQGFEAFKDDPPVDKGVKYSEANSKQVSFLTLYNPDSKAEGQCSVATCTVSEDTGGEGQEKTVSGLVCSTTPNVFGKESLFTQNQWDSIKGVLSNSASATVPSILALATLLIAALVS